MSIPPYISDILNQPEGLQMVLANYQPDKLQEITSRIAGGEYQRVVMTGMGASFTSCYPAFIILSNLGIPISMVETSELLHYLPGMINDKTLLWVNSQSGRSAEILSLINRMQDAPVRNTVGVTNELDSPLGCFANPVLPLYSGVEATVSTRSYINTLAVTLLGATQLTGGDLDQACSQLSGAVNGMKAYLEDWRDRVEEIKIKIGAPKSLMVIGRGPSLAAVRTSSFTMKEAAKAACEGMESAQFRHGPLEMVSPDLTAVVFEGLSKTSDMNRQIAHDTAELGGHAIWVGSQPDPELPSLVLPGVPNLALPLVEILPLQMMTIAFSELSGIEPGKFRYMGKVTLVE